MRRLATALMVCLFSIPCYAASYTAPAIDIKVTVAKQLALDYWAYDVPADSLNPSVDGNLLAPGAELDFGDLAWNEDYGIWMAQKYFCVFLAARTYGDRYQIKQTCYGFKSGTKDLTKSLTMTPDYQAKDRWSAIDPNTEQGNMPPGDSVGSAQLAVGSDKLVYDGWSGLTRMVRVYYGIFTGDSNAKGYSDLVAAGAKVCTGEQPAGPYSGVITFTLTTM